MAKRVLLRAAHHLPSDGYFHRPQGLAIVGAAVALVEAAADRIFIDALGPRI